MARRLIAPMLAVLASVAALTAGEQASSDWPGTFHPVLVRSAQERTQFASLIARISEEGRYFDTDNLITNERSYLHAIGKLEALGIAGGAYIGVGPGQNFSYIAQVRPSVALLVDIRRDNLLQHFLYKALFETSDGRLEYLCKWLGRTCPNVDHSWQNSSIQELIEYVDQAPPDPTAPSRLLDQMRETIRGYGFHLTEEDFASVERFYSAFAARGLDLRFTSHGRGPLPDYPTLRQLLLETDLAGHNVHYLASEERFNLVKSLQQRDLIVPVVGDLAGDRALAEIGRFLEERGQRVSAFYTSNVEYYLMRDGSFGNYIQNLERLPIDDNSVIIRSYFNRGFRDRHPDAVPGYSSTQLVQTIEDLLADHAKGRVSSYWDLVTGGR